MKNYDSVRDVSIYNYILQISSVQEIDIHKIYCKKLIYLHCYLYMGKTVSSMLVYLYIFKDYYHWYSGCIVSTFVLEN